MSYRIKTVVELTGIPRNTLIAWERRYQLLEPRRSDAGYRIYEETDVAYLRGLKALVDGGVAISEAISRFPAPGQASPGGVSRPDLVAGLVAALVGCNMSGASPLMRRVEQMPFAEAIQDVWRPVLFEVGRLWALDEISVAQEHFATGVVRVALAAMLRSLESARDEAVEVVCACLPGEAHDLPLLAVAVELALAGWRVIWLGADVPLADLCALVATRTPEIVCLSAVGTWCEDEVLAAGRTVLGSARTTIVVLGGPAGLSIQQHQGQRLWACGTAAELVRRWYEHPIARPDLPSQPKKLA